MILNFNDFNINERNYPQGWSFEIFKALRSFAKRKQYCDTHLEKISSGSARIAYIVDEDTVLKLAKNEKGIAQNMVEISYSANDYYLEEMGILTKVYEYDEDGTWLDVERARKLTKKEFKNIVGYSFDEFVEGIKYIGHTYGSSRIRYPEPDNFEDMNENDFISNIFEFLGNYDIPHGDLTRISSYGIVNRDGKDVVVLTDYGLDNQVMDKYYRRK